MVAPVPTPAVVEQTAGLSVPVVEEIERKDLAPSPVPSMAVSVSSTTETAPSEDVVMEDAVEEQQPELPVVEEG